MDSDKKDSTLKSSNPEDPNTRDSNPEVSDTEDFDTNTLVRWRTRIQHQNNQRTRTRPYPNLCQPPNPHQRLSQSQSNQESSDLEDFRTYPSLLEPETSKT